MAVTKLTTPTSRQPNRILILLAAAWIAISLAIGGARVDVPSADQVSPARAAVDTAQP